MIAVIECGYRGKVVIRVCFLQKTHHNSQNIAPKVVLFLKKLAETRKIHINSLKIGAKN